MRYRIDHTTRYVYAGEAFDSHNEVRMTPHSDEAQTCRRFRLTVDPKARLFHYDLPWGRVHHFDVADSHESLTVRMEAEVEIRVNDPFTRMNLAVDDARRYDQEVRAAYWEWLTPTRRVPHDLPEVAPALDTLAAQARAAADGPTAAHFLIALTDRIHREFPFDATATHVGTTMPELLVGRRGGVCQDHAHLMLAVCRRQGIPARYVSGYLYTGGGLTSGDVMHAWVECLVADAYGGATSSPWLWRGFDPTNNLVAGRSYVKVFVGRDYDDAAPMRGVYTGAPTERLEVSVRLTELNEETEQES